MKRKILVLFLLFFVFGFGKAQTVDKIRNNALSFELGKTGLIYNISFDHRYLRNKKGQMGLRILAGSNFGKYFNAFTVGGGIYFLFGRNKDFFEMDLAATYLKYERISNDQRGVILVYPNHSFSENYMPLSLGYRKELRKKLFRIGISGGFIQNDFIAGGYLSYGFRF